MGESTYSATLNEARQEVSQYLGFGRFADAGEGLSADQATTVAAICKSGLRQFFGAYAWSFMRPATTIVAWNTATGTAAVDGPGSTRITDSTNSPFYPSMVGRTLTFDTSGTEYTILGYSSSSVIYVDADASADTGDTFTITATGDYRLPDNVIEIDGRLTYATSQGYVAVTKTSEERIRSYRQYNTGTGRPQCAAIIPVSGVTLHTFGTTPDAETATITDSTNKPFRPWCVGCTLKVNANSYTISSYTSTSTVTTSSALVAADKADPFYVVSSVPTGQRYDLMLWPTPDTDCTLGYRYFIAPDALDENELLPGGFSYVECVIQSCLAVAENRIDREKGIQWDKYAELLKQAVDHDRRAFAADNIGYMADESDIAMRAIEPAVMCSSQVVQYNGGT